MSGDRPLGSHPDQVNVVGSTTTNNPVVHQHHTTEAQFAQQSGLGNLLDTIPELRTLVDQALAHNWTASHFMNAVEDSDWYKNHSDTARQTIVQQANDPRSYEQNLHTAEQSVQQLAQQLGMSLNAGQLQAIAVRSMMTGNTSNQAWLTEAISNREDYSHIKDIGSLQGGMASTAEQVQALADQYGFNNWTPAQIAAHAQDVIDGTTTMDTYKARLIKWAQSAFPGLAKDLADGTTTLSDLASPYVQSMSNLLEVDPGTLNVFTPKIRRALQGVTDPKTKDRAPISLADFEDQVRSDPRWQYTQNAKDTVSTALLKIGSDFGFGPEG